MKKFIEAAQDRDQQSLFQQTLEESISANHPVRAIDAVVELFDFIKWENEYSGGGRPSYSPHDMVKLFIYGNMNGILSSRKLEYACKNNKDYIWLMKGLEPDHDTIADFRKRNRKRFKEMFLETVRVGMEAGIISMRSLAIDGSRVRSNSSRWGTKNEKEIEKLLLDVESRIEVLIDKAEEEDEREDDLFGEGVSSNGLSAEMADLKRRQDILKKAFERIKKKTAKAKARGEKADKKRVPVTDPDSDVMKSKDGGYEPNYNVHVAVDSESRMIVSEGVNDEHTDAGHLRSLYEESCDATGIGTKQVLADSAYSTTENLEYLNDNGIDACMPPLQSGFAKSSKDKIWPDDIPYEATDVEGNRIDGRKIPRNSKGKFDKSAFRYCEEEDLYQCPMGFKMRRISNTVNRKNKPKVVYRYKCKECANCQFKPVCTDAPARTINRNEDAWIHERHNMRFNSHERRKASRLRGAVVEPVFGIIKNIHRLRMFMTRGLESVETEWTIASTAYNVRKLINHMNKTPAPA